MEAVQPLTGSIGELVRPSQSNHLPPGAPVVDHTTNSNKGTYFLFMNDQDRQVPTTYIDTLSMSNLPAEQTDSCVRFAYQINGNVIFKVLIMAVNSFDYHAVMPRWKSAL